MVVWVVRAGNHGEREDFALEHKVVVNGWDEVPDLRQFATREELADFYREIHPDYKPMAIANHVGQLWAFATKIKIGHLAVLPLKTRAAIAVGEVVGPYEFRPDNPLGARHVCPVRWLRTDIPRTHFDQDLLASFGSLLTVSQVRCENAAERIRAILEERPPALRPVPDDDAERDTEVPEAEESPLDVAGYSRDQIQRFIGQQFHGHALADLVAAVLEAQGYQTFVSSPGPDGGVDIIVGKGAMGFDQPRLCVQVKSSAQPVAVDILRQLKGVLHDFDAQHGLLVSWGGFRESVYREARRLFFQIRLWDGGDLGDEVLACYDRLPADLRTELPLKRIWTLVLDE